MTGLTAETTLDTKTRHVLRGSTRRISLQNPNAAVTSSLALPSCNIPSVSLLPIQNLSRWPHIDTALQCAPFGTSVADLWTSTTPSYLKSTPIMVVQDAQNPEPEPDQIKQKPPRPPMLRPSLKSSRSRSAPSTPVATKSVHFDFPLEHISLFTSTSDKSRSECDEDEDVAYFGHDPFVNRYTGGYSPKTSPGPVLTLPNWPSDLPVRFFTQMVSLESIIFDPVVYILRGAIQVQNIAFQKTVTLRYSTDAWATWTDVGAIYKESVGGDCENSALDRFVFSINISPATDLLTTQLSMAVRYQVREREFWDNNGGKNFRVQWRLPPQPSDGDVKTRQDRRRTNTVGDLGFRQHMDTQPISSFRERYSFEQALSRANTSRTNTIFIGEKSL
ncbi:putative phosphatase regulatory subunit-domain-containing protein [Phycomyces nitens]|nr:putative phosphatase regulatory subunit-domain-containing protein [Phycomyces nitens]